jgi:hypothetical protein
MYFLLLRRIAEKETIGKSQAKRPESTGSLVTVGRTADSAIMVRKWLPLRI